MTHERAIEMLTNMRNNYDAYGQLTGDDEITQMLDTAIESLKERKTGRWIRHENHNLGKCMQITYECSVCKTGVGCEYFLRRSYCPNCGAEMEGAEE